MKFFVFSAVMDKLNYKSYVWIGLNDIKKEGSWIWVNGKPATATDALWISGEPNNAGGNEDCGIAVYNRGTNDGNCASTIVGLCEKAYGAV